MVLHITHISDRVCVTVTQNQHIDITCHKKKKEKEIKTIVFNIIKRTVDSNSLETIRNFCTKPNRNRHILYLLASYITQFLFVLYVKRKKNTRVECLTRHY